jgi:hypothetical protein
MGSFSVSIMYIHLEINYGQGKTMSINYTILDKGKYLKIISAGACENLNQLKEYVLAIHNATVSSGQKRVLVDETQLEYKLSTLDSFDSGRFVSSISPKPKKLAVLCKLENWNDTKFWETVAVNRGVPVKIFRNQDSAEKWIMS